jgi:tetratricopeptide (TPR) repeat protein
MTPHAEARTPEWCESRWQEVSAPHLQSPTPDYAQLLRTWQQMHDECTGTAVYEVRLASIYLMQKQHAEAQKVLRSIDKAAPKYAPLLESTRLQADVASATASQDPATADIRRFSPRFESLLANAPSWYVAHEQVATFRLMSGEPRRAIEAAERAIELEPASWWSYRTMAIAYSELGEHKIAVAMGDRAHAIHSAVSADADLMLALARSYASLGNRQMSETLLGLLFKYRPEVRQTSQYRDTLVFIRDAIGGSHTDSRPQP